MPKRVGRLSKALDSLVVASAVSGVVLWGWVGVDVREFTEQETTPVHGDTEGLVILAGGALLAVAFMLGWLARAMKSGSGAAADAGSFGCRICGRADLVDQHSFPLPNGSGRTVFSKCPKCGHVETQTRNDVDGW